MAPKYLGLLCLCFIASIVAGCASTPYSNVATYSDGQDVYTEENIKVHIGKSYWTDIVGFQKPDAKFLIVEVSIENIGKKPVTVTPPVFTVVNEQGYEYELSRHATGFGPTSFFDNLLGQTMKRLSPLIPISGYIVFDVPSKFNYTLIVSQGEQQTTYKLVRKNDIAKFKLTPADKSALRKKEP